MAGAMSTLAVRLGALEDFTSGDRYLLTLLSLSSSQQSERQIVLFRLARMGIDRFYAIESECPHAGGPMLDAEVVAEEPETDDIEDLFDNVVAVCPWHSYDFNLITGESSTGFHACTWRAFVDEGPDGTRAVFLEGPESSGDWLVKSIEGVSESEWDISGNSAPTIDVMLARICGNASHCDHRRCV